MLVLRVPVMSVLAVDRVPGRFLRALRHTRNASEIFSSKCWVRPALPLMGALHVRDTGPAVRARDTMAGLPVNENNLRGR